MRLPPERVCAFSGTSTVIYVQFMLPQPVDECPVPHSCARYYQSFIVDQLFYLTSICFITSRVGLLLVFLKKIYLFIYRERGREGGKEVAKHQCVVASHAPPATGYPTHSLGMCPDWESNQRPLGSQAHAQSTELYQPGPARFFFSHLYFFCKLPVPNPLCFILLKFVFLKLIVMLCVIQILILLLNANDFSIYHLSFHLFYDACATEKFSQVS